MPKKSQLLPCLLLAALAGMTVPGPAAWAQQPPTVRIRGTIEAVDGPVLAVKSRDGTEMKVRVRQKRGPMAELAHTYGFTPEDLA